MGVREKLLPGCPLSPGLQEVREEAQGALEHRSQSRRQRGGSCSLETPSQSCPMAAPLSVPGTPGVSTLLTGAPEAVHKFWKRNETTRVQNRGSTAHTASGAPKTSSPQTHTPQGSQHQPQQELGGSPQG